MLAVNPTTDIWVGILDANPDLQLDCAEGDVSGVEHLLSSLVLSILEEGALRPRKSMSRCPEMRLIGL